MDSQIHGCIVLHTVPHTHTHARARARARTRTRTHTHTHTHTHYHTNAHTHTHVYKQTNTKIYIKRRHSCVQLLSSFDVISLVRFSEIRAPSSAAGIGWTWRHQTSTGTSRTRAGQSLHGAVSLPPGFRGHVSLYITPPSLTPRGSYRNVFAMLFNI